MARKLRRDVVVPDAPHHVIVRGNNKRTLFSYDPERAGFLALLLDASKGYAVLIHALTLMKNHVHLVLTPSCAEALAALMKRVGQRTAVRRNRLRGGSGKLFEQRYHAIPILGEGQLAATIPYAELNCERAGIGSAASYDWSTYRLHAGIGIVHPTLAELWRPHPWWTELSSDPQTRYARYRELVQRRRDNHRAGLAPDSIRYEPPDQPYTRRLVRPDGTSAR